MSKAIEVEGEESKIMEALREFPKGATAEEIRRASGLALKLRTIQRRLEKLVTNEKVTQTGIKRGAKFHLPEETARVGSRVPDRREDTAKRTTTDGGPVSTVAPKETIASSDAIPLSPESKAILARLEHPYEARGHVGYNRAFLDGYQPNEDYYLTATEREDLAALSVTTRNGDQPAGTYARHILQRLLIDLSWNSSRLEGNTYSLLDTERLIERGKPAEGKSAEETQMILNHKEGIEFIVTGGEDIGFNRYTVQNLHALLSNNLLPDPAAPGRLRNYAVGIQKSVYTPPAIPQLIEEMFDRMLEKAAAIKDPHEAALFVMIHLPYLQPFEDVNKRVSRLAANIPLNAQNRVPLSFIGVPHDLYVKGLLGVYELNRTELLKDIFIWACRRSADRYAAVRQTVGEPNPFRVKYRDELRHLVSEIVRDALDRATASITIGARALRLPASDRKAFIELSETELLSLHEGNFARYGVTPAEFRAWRAGWKK